MDARLAKTRPFARSAREVCGSIKRITNVSTALVISTTAESASPKGLLSVMNVKVDTLWSMASARALHAYQALNTTSNSISARIRFAKWTTAACARAKALRYATAAKTTIGSQATLALMRLALTLAVVCVTSLAQLSARFVNQTSTGWISAPVRARPAQVDSRGMTSLLNVRTVLAKSPTAATVKRLVSMGATNVKQVTSLMNPRKSVSLMSAKLRTVAGAKPIVTFVRLAKAVSGCKETNV